MMKFKRMLVPVIAAALVGGADLQAQTAEPGTATERSWRIDTSHSELSFRVRHLLSRVQGNFGEWGGTIYVDPDDLTGGRVEVDIAAATINTNNDSRDADLRGEEFFAAESHPTITFRSRSVEASGSDLRVHGDLTIRGITRPVVLEGTFLGRGRDGQGRERIGFEAETVINRHDFDITWNRMVEGGRVLGEEVTISIAVQAVEQG